MADFKEQILDINLDKSYFPAYNLIKDEIQFLKQKDYIISNEL